MSLRVCQLLFLLGAAAPRTWAAACDCTHFPYNPESCEKKCSGVVLNNASPKDLVGLLGLKKTTTDSIVTFRKSHPLTSIDDLKIEPSKKSEIEDQFRNLNSQDGRKLAEKYGSDETQDAVQKNSAKKPVNAK